MPNISALYRETSRSRMNLSMSQSQAAFQSNNTQVQSARRQYLEGGTLNAGQNSAAVLPGRRLPNVLLPDGAAGKAGLGGNYATKQLESGQATQPLNIGTLSRTGNNNVDLASATSSIANQEQSMMDITQKSGISAELLQQQRPDQDPPARQREHEMEFTDDKNGIFDTNQTSIHGDGR